MDPRKIVFGLALFALASASASNQWPPSSYCGRPPIYSESLHRDAFRSGLSLVQVQAIFRHGDRLPIGHCWSNDNDWQCSLRHEERMNADAIGNRNVARMHRKNYINGKNINPGNCASGALTNIGFHQHIANGVYLRDAYVTSGKLLPLNFDVSKLHVRSTDYPRTFASVEGLLQGMYPLPSSSQSIQFVNISTVDGQLEYLYPSSTFCPKVGEYKDQFVASAEYQNHLSTVTLPLITELEAALNTKFTSKPNDAINNIFDCFQAHLCHNFSLPSSITYDLYQRVVAEQTYFYGATYYYPDRVSAGKVGVGLMLSEVNDFFVQAIGNKTQVKMALWSAHDTTVMPVLAALGVWDRVWAPYASIITLELWKDAQAAFFVRLLYQGEPLKMPGCAGGVFCSWSDFQALMSPLFLTNPTVDCSVSRMHVTSDRARQHQCTTPLDE